MLVRGRSLQSTSPSPHLRPTHTPRHPSLLFQHLNLQLLEKLQVSSSPQSFSSSLSLELLLLEQVLLLVLPGQVEQVQGQGWSVQSDLVGNIMVL